MKYNAFVFLFMILIGCNMPEVKTGKPLSYHFDASAGIWTEVSTRKILS